VNKWLDNDQILPNIVLTNQAKIVPATQAKIVQNTNAFDK